MNDFMDDVHNPFNLFYFIFGNLLLGEDENVFQCDLKFSPSIGHSVQTEVTGKKLMQCSQGTSFAPPISEFS